MKMYPGAIIDTKTVASVVLEECRVVSDCGHGDMGKEGSIVLLK